MPKTKFQNLIFTLIMVFFMVFCMTAFTITDKMGGLSYRVFAAAIREMWPEYIIVFLLIFFVITHLAQKLAFRIVSAKEDKPIFVILAIQCCTVCLIVPTITLIATLLHHGATSMWLVQWLTSAFRCFPAALCLQVFFVGPLVRLLFRTLFRKRLARQ